MFTGIGASGQPKIDDLESGLGARKYKKIFEIRIAFQRCLNEM